LCKCCVIDAHGDKQVQMHELTADELTAHSALYVWCMQCTLLNSLLSLVSVCGSVLQFYLGLYMWVSAFS
jgi:hypothetical protein